MSSNADPTEDYMSDAFVSDRDVRPSLLFSHRSRVEHESMKKKRKCDPKPNSYYVALEHELREHALSTPLDDSNRGAQMMKRMGFGAVADGSGRRAPIEIELKNDRKGLGCVKTRAVTRSANTCDAQHAQRQYLARKKSEKMSILAEKDLKTCQKVCHALDTDANVVEGKQHWFWPSLPKREEEEEEEEEEESEDNSELSADNKLVIVNEYLRSQHFYCIWCAIKFDDSEDIDHNCPGNTREAHD